MLDPNHDNETHLESQGELVAGIHSLYALGIGMSWSISSAYIRDLRRLNPFYDAFCSFWLPHGEEWQPPTRVPLLDAYLGKHLSLVGN